MVKNANMVKKANEALVLDSIRKSGGITTETIIAETGLSRPTVLSVIKQQLNDDIVEKSGYMRQSVGRQPVLYSLSKNSFFVIGVDVDVAPIYLTITQLSGAVIYNTKWKVSVNSDAYELLDSIMEKIKKSLEIMKILPGQVLGLGIGLPAIIDVRKNTAETISRIRGWKNINVAQIFEKEFGFKTYVRNDAHLLGLMEKNERKATNMIYILHRSGIGLAPIIEGELYEGCRGNAGYIGHSRIDSRGKDCKCGAKDCLELYCSKRSIEHNYNEATGQELDYDEIIKEADSENEFAITVLQEAGAYFGRGISNAIKSYDILEVVIGDLRCSENHIFFQSIVKSVAENVVEYCGEKPSIELSKCNSGMYGLGACYFVLNDFFEQPKLHTNISGYGGEVINDKTI